MFRQTIKKAISLTLTGSMLINLLVVMPAGAEETPAEPSLTSVFKNPTSEMTQLLNEFEAFKAKTLGNDKEAADLEESLKKYNGKSQFIISSKLSSLGQIKAWYQSQEIAEEKRKFNFLRSDRLLKLKAKTELQADAVFYKWIMPKVEDLYNQTQKMITNSNLTNSEKMAFITIYTSYVYESARMIFATLFEDKIEFYSSMTKLNSYLLSFDLLDSNDEIKSMMDAADLTIRTDKKIEISQLAKIDNSIQVFKNINSSLFLVRAHKLAIIKDLIQRQMIYQKLAGIGSQINLPNSCRVNQPTVMYHSMFFQPLTKEQRDYQIELLLFNSGLVTSTKLDTSINESLNPDQRATRQAEVELLTQIKDTYLETKSDLFEAGHTNYPILPFESRLASDYYLNQAKPEVDSSLMVEYIPQIVESIIQGQIAKYNNYHDRYYKNAPPEIKAKSNTLIYQLLKKTEPILASVSKFKFEKNASFWADDKNINQYLYNLMVTNSESNFENVVPEAIINELKAQPIKLEFPQKYSNVVWKKWALNKIYNYLNMNQNKQELKSYIYTKCRSISSGLCNSKAVTLDQPFEKVMSYLSRFKNIDAINMRAPITTDEYQMIYPVLSKLWDEHYGLILAANQIKTNEWDFIVNTKDINPLGIVKISLMMIMKTEVHMAVSEVFKTLKLNKPLTINHLGKFMSADELKSILFEIREQEDQKTIYALNSKKAGTKFNNYELMRIVAESNIYGNKSELNNALKLNLDSQNSINQKNSQINNEPSGLLASLYMNRGNKDAQIEILEKLGLNFDTEITNLNGQLLDYEMSIKANYFKAVFAEAITQRVTENNKNLDFVCSQNIFGSEEEFNNIMKQSTPATKIINASENPLVTDRADNMTDIDKGSLILGLGSAGLLIAGTILSGGILAPVLIVSSFGLAATTAILDYKSYTTSDARSRIFQDLEQFGLAKYKTSSDIHMSAFWPVLSVAFVLPMTGVVARSLKMTRVYAKNFGVLIQTYKGQAGKLIFKNQEVRYLFHVNEARNIIKANESLSNIEERTAESIKDYFKNKDAFIKFLKGQSKKLPKLNPVIDELTLSSSDFSKVIVKHADVLEQASREFKFKMKELPFFIADFESLGGVKKIPFTFSMADRVMLRRILSSYRVLKYEKELIAQRQILGLADSKAINGGWNTFVDFKKTIAEIENMGKRKLKRNRAELMTDIATNILNYQRSHKFVMKGLSKITVDQLAKELEKETILAHVLFERTPSAHIFGIASFKEESEEIIKQFKNYENVSSFSKYVNALKINLIEKRPELLNYYL